MVKHKSVEFTELQQYLIAMVKKYEGQFSRSGLSKMLVGASSWRDESFLEYGTLSEHGRKAVTFQIDVLIQQQYMAVNEHDRLIPVSTEC